MTNNRSSSSRKSSYLKWGVGVGGALILLIAAYWAAETYLENALQEQVEELGQQLSGEPYSFQLGDLNLNLWNQQLEATDLSVAPTPPANDSLYLQSATVGAFSMTGFDLVRWLTDGALSIGQVRVDSAVVIMRGRVRQNLWDDFRKMVDAETSKTQTYKVPVEVGQIQLSRANFKLLHPQDSTLEAQLGQLDLDLHDICLDSAATNTAPRLHIGDINLQGSDFFSQTYQDFYNLRLASFSLNSTDSTLTIDSLRMEPSYERYIFSEKNGREIDRISMLIPSIQLSGFDVAGLREQRLGAQKLHIDDLEMDIFRDKHPPAPLKETRQLPQLALAELPIAFQLDTVALTDASITYGEHLPQSDIPGEVSFVNLNAEITGINTDSVRQKNAAPMHISIETSLLGVAPLRLEGDFHQSPDGAHELKGSLGAMQLSKLNPVLEPLGFVSISSGELNSMEYSMQLDNQQAQGEVIMEYHDLKIELLEHGELKEEQQKNLLSFLANALKIKSDNNGEPLRKGEVDFQRDASKSIFNYWWKSLQSGLKSSVGL